MQFDCVSLWDTNIAEKLFLSVRKQQINENKGVNLYVNITDNILITKFNI